ncbi:hypothetical protein CDD83_10943 [Cordyceps sp. RAO-2017]|nr:hypothetical protein CDD83_10943 [Cordyceps sp. RAO-2017]
MADYAPPTGPPPPKAPEVPAGWAARWNEQYKEWFYVNVYTKKSQWEKPTAPVFPVGEDAPNEPPPGYEPGHGPAPTDTKKNPYEDRTAGPKPPAASSAEDEDAKLAAKLQAEEDARARHSPAGPQYGGGANASYPPQSGSPYPQDQYSQDRDRDKAKGGFLGKLFGKGKAPGAAGYGGYSPQPQQNYYQSPPPQQQQQYGGGNCQSASLQFTKCMDEHGGNMQICNWYLEQLKACQAAANQ